MLKLFQMLREVKKKLKEKYKDQKVILFVMLGLRLEINRLQDQVK
jgi:hypothetical protein